MMLSCMAVGTFSASAATDHTGWTAISTQAELAAITNSMSGNYYLTCDIELSGTWIPLGKSTSSTDSYTAFTGNFDGNGYTISNLTISSGTYNYVGLFAYNNGTIENVTVEVNSVTGGSYVGTLVGHNYSGTIQNCSVIGNGYTSSIITGNDTDAQHIGGLVGCNGTSSSTSAVITECSVSDLNVRFKNYSSSSANSAAGDFLGCFAGGNFATISYCSATQCNTNASNVGSTACSVGGFVGGNKGTITYSYTYTSLVIYGGDHTGTFAGSHYSSSYIKYCYAYTYGYSYPSNSVPAISYNYLFIGYNMGSTTSNYCYTASSNSSTASGATKSSSLSALTTSVSAMSAYTLVDGVPTLEWELECAHVYTSVTTPATCTAAGSITYTCSICGDTYTEAIESLGHTWIVDETTDENGWKVTLEPTCITAGEKQRECSVCDFYVESQAIAATGVHSYGDDGYCTTEDCDAYDASYVVTTTDPEDEDDDDTDVTDPTGTTTDPEDEDGDDDNYSESQEGGVDVSEVDPYTDVMNVEITWGALEFTYTDSKLVWDTETMTWIESEVEAAGWSYEEDSNIITIKNNSSLDALVTVTCSSDYDDITISYSTEADTDEDDKIIVYSPANVDYTNNEHIETIEITVDGYDETFTSTQSTRIGGVTLVFEVA